MITHLADNFYKLVDNLQISEHRTYNYRSNFFVLDFLLFPVVKSITELCRYVYNLNVLMCSQLTLMISNKSKMIRNI